MRRALPIILAVLALLIVGLVALHAQKAPNPNWYFYSGNALGAPCIGCQLVTCTAGLTCTAPPAAPGANALATYTTPAGGTPNANPVILDSAGSAQIWTTPGLSYRFDLYSAANVLIRSVDNIPGGSLIGTSNVNANYIYAGPVSGGAATPTFRATVAADLGSLVGSCTNQFLISIGMCGTVTLAGPQFANQGTTVTVPHGNAAGNPAWGPVVGADFGTGVAARSFLGNATAGTAAPSLSSTVDVLAYQVAEIPSILRVTTDFVTAANTNLQLITGLTFTIPASTALNVPFVCKFTYQQGTANVAVAFGIQDVTVSPTNISARGTISTNTTVYTSAILTGLASTTATAIVSATPAATATDFVAEISGMIEAPSNASSSAINIMVSTATAGDAVTIRRGSFCKVN